MTLHWTPTTYSGARVYCTGLPDGRLGYVERSPLTGGWSARIVARPGATPAASAIRPTLRAAQTWVADRYPSELSKVVA